MGRLAAALQVVVALLMVPRFAAALTPPSMDARQVSSPTGTSQTILHIAEVGRYAVTAQSPTGASFEIVDRMAGSIASASPAAVSGSTGRQARVDAYLEPGEYQVRVTHPRTETVALDVKRFDTLNAGPGGAPIAVLEDGATVRGELGDLQVSQYWVILDAAHRTLLLEAWGRNLKDVAVWKDGVWDTGLRPQASTMELQPGKPQTVLELNATLEPGSYLVTCAGGPRAAWAKDSDAQPFFINRGARFLGEMGRMSLIIPPQGIASFLVSGSVSFAEMEVPRAGAYRLSLGGNYTGRSRYTGARQAVITEKSSSLRCQVSGSPGGATAWIVVQGPAGDTVAMDWVSAFAGGGQRPFPESGSYLTSVLSSLEGENSMDATGVILQYSRASGRNSLDIRALQAVPLSADQPVRRQINCLGDVSFLLQPRKGTYAVFEKDSATVSARYRFSLVDDVLFPSDTQPIVVSAGGRVDLSERLYLVTVSPVKAGVLDFAFVPTIILGITRPGSVFASPPPAPQTDIGWPSTSVTQTDSASTYLLLPSRRDVSQGFAVRKLPADLTQPLPIRVDPGQTFTFSFTLSAEAALASTSRAFTPSTVTVDSAPWFPGQAYPAGGHTCSVRNTASTAEWHVISAMEPERPAAPAPGVTGLSNLPSLPDGAPAWQDFDRAQTTSWLLTVPSPGSYRIVTMGRLAMGLALRSPLRGAFASGSENVDGRNAEIIAYLRPGSYMVQAAAHGSSAGRAGILLQHMPLVDAGTVRDGEVLRASVEAGSLLQADVQVDAEGIYSLECRGLDRTFPWRLEDEDGWPLGNPVQQGTLSQRLPPGTYHYISMADAETTRRVLAFQSAPTPRPVDPNAKRVTLVLNQPVQKTWNESDGRPADVFDISLPAEVRATLSLSAGMLFRLVDAKGAVPYQGIGGKAVPVTLPAGAWRMEVTSLLEDNQKQYQVSLTTGDLLAGVAQAVSSSQAVIPVSIGAAGTVEIWSYGGNELDASLTDESGRLVAAGQTIPDDWNFRVLTQVAPGRYLLHVSSPLFNPLPSSPAPVPRPAPAPAPTVDQDESSGEVSSDEEDSGDSDMVSGGEEEGTDDQEAPAPAPAAEAAAPSLGGMSLLRLVVRDEKPLPAAASVLAASVDLGQEIAVVPFTSGDAGVYRVEGESAVPVSAAVFRDGRLLATGPSPLRVVLAQGQRYTLRFWCSVIRTTGVKLAVGPERFVDAAAEGPVNAAAPALRLSFPAGTSYHLEADAGQLLYSAGPEDPFVPVGDAAVSSTAGAGWAIRPDGSAVGACRVSTLTLRDGATEGLLVGDGEGSFTLRVPSRSAALVWTENAGSIIGLSAASSAPRPGDGFDWRGTLVSTGRSVLGLREGSFRGRVWSTEPGGSREDRRVRLSARLFPLVSESALAKGGQTLTVPAGSAVALTPGAGTRFIEVSLDGGLAAMAWANGPSGAVDATEGPVTGRLDASGGSIVIVNLLPTAGLAVVREGSPSPPPEVSESASWESAHPDALVTVDVKGARPPSRLYLYGAAGSARLYSAEDGRVYQGTRVSADFGTALFFPAHRGRLVVQGAAGPVRTWVCPPDQVLAGFAGRDSRAQQAGLPPEGGVLQASPQVWTVTLDADSFVSVRAENDGILAVYGSSGACLKATASVGGRSLAAMLPRGSYTVFTRPFVDSSAAGGAVVLRRLAPQALEADGPGPEVLVGSRDAILYRFTVAVEGKVGCGVRGRSDTLTATLRDGSFSIIDTGRIFVRTLPAGTYYLLVEANGQAQRFSPVVYGLKGNDALIPDDVLSSYKEE